VERETEYLNFNLFYKHQVEKVLQLSLVPSFKGIYHQIANCFHHLIYNALDAIYDTKKKLITITTDSQNGKVLLKVSDTGIGIPRENMNKIFDIGFTTKLNPSQVPERDYPSGYGLGLYIVRKILNNYGGEIHIESKVGEGTVVEVAIPLKQKL
jgi:signal transduction histidine kinase